MILFTQINVPMTDFKVDVLIGGTKEENILVETNRYGFSEEESQNIEKNECASITTGLNGFLKPQKIFCLRLAVMPMDDIPVLIHELWHLIWHISDVIGDFKLSQASQSWAACMIETISRDIINAKYEQLNLEYGE